MLGLRIQLLIPVAHVSDQLLYCLIQLDLHLLAGHTSFEVVQSAGQRLHRMFPIVGMHHFMGTQRADVTLPFSKNCGTLTVNHQIWKYNGARQDDPGVFDLAPPFAVPTDEYPVLNWLRVTAP